MPRRFVYFQGQRGDPIVLFACDSNWVRPENDVYPNEAIAFCRAILRASNITGSTVYSMAPSDLRVFSPLSSLSLLTQAIADEGLSIVYGDISAAQGYIVLPLLSQLATLTTVERDNIRTQGRRHGAFLIGEQDTWGGTALNAELTSIFKAGWTTTTELGKEPLISTGRYETTAGEIAEISGETGLGAGWFTSGPSIAGPETLAYVVVDGVSISSIVDLNIERLPPTT